MEVTYIDHMGSDLTVVNAARVSLNKESEWAYSEVVDFYDTEDGGPVPIYHRTLSDKDTKLIQYLSKHNHWTPFAHPQVTLRIKAPIFIRTQCFKHKQGFVENEVSRRYVDDEPTFFIPDLWRKKADNKKQGSSDETVEHFAKMYAWEYDGFYPVDKISDEVQYLFDHALYAYKKMLEAGVAPEQARMVLPQAMYTEWYWTGSLAAYARFYKQRSDSHAQQEIRELAKKVGEVIQPLFPVSWRELTS